EFNNHTSFYNFIYFVCFIVSIGCTLFIGPAFISLTIIIVITTICAIITCGITLATIWSMWFKGDAATTTFEPVNELLTKGGINSMLFTISLVLLALGFGGLLFVTGIMPTILSTLKSRLKKTRSIIIATATTAIGVNISIGEQYLSVLLTGETYKDVYKQAGLPNKMLSRTLEDAGTVINPLVPWSVCGVFIADVLGVPVLTYLPFPFFCLLSPIITVLFNRK